VKKILGGEANHNPQYSTYCQTCFMRPSKET